MRAYILSIAGAVLLSALLSVVLPFGKMGSFIKGMTKLVLLVVLITPFFSLAKGEELTFGTTALKEDETYMRHCALLLEEEDEKALSALLYEKFSIQAEVDVERGTDLTRKKVSVNITDFGIYGQDPHIDMIADVKTFVERTCGCPAEVS